jgi:hypothetical protein
MSKNKITQGTTTQLAILSVLKRLKESGPVDVATVTAEILKDMGLPQKMAEEKEVRNAINNAKFALNVGVRDCLASEKGKWTITDIGLAAVESGTIPPDKRGKNKGKAEGGAPKAASSKKSTKKAAAADASSEGDPGPPAPVVEKPKAKPRLSIVGPETAAEESWVHDEEIRTLVVANTPCYGSYSPIAKECGKCPLRGHCGDALARMLTGIAEAISAEANQRTVIPGSIVADVGVAGAAALTPGPRKAATTGKPLKIFVDGAICARTFNPLPKGSNAYYIPGVGNVSFEGLTDEERAGFPYEASA